MTWIPAMPWVEAWMQAMARASLAGGLTVLAGWLICRFLPRMSPWARSWIWRCVYLKLILLLLWQGSIPLRLLPHPGVWVELAQTLPSVDARPLNLSVVRPSPALNSSLGTRIVPEWPAAWTSGVALFGVWLLGISLIAIWMARLAFATRRTLRG